MAEALRHVALGLFVGAGLHAAAAYADPETDALKVEIATRWHVTIIDQDLAKRISPIVAGPDRPITMQDLSAENEHACLNAVATAFSAYSAEFFSDLVQQVALADVIYVWHIRVGGFHAPGLIALNCQDADSYEGFIVDSMHDEIAVSLLMKAPLDRTAWQRLNSPGFSYGDIGSYHDELRDPHDRAGDAALHDNGFVSRLGLTGLDNDFETYAERIFGHPQEFAALLRRYPAMRGKARIVMALYLQAAPSLKNQFAASGLTQAAQ